MSGLYILHGKQPVKCMSSEAWARWMSKHRDKLLVARTRLCDFGYKDVIISTVFLGIDTAHGARVKTPILFETMSFGAELDGQLFDRYATWEEAEAGHQRAVKEATRELYKLRGRMPKQCQGKRS